MISKLFGSQQLKTRSDIKTANKDKRSTRKKTANDKWGLGSLDNSYTGESWGTEATDALKVPILAKAHTDHVLCQENTRLNSVKVPTPLTVVPINADQNFDDSNKPTEKDTFHSSDDTLNPPITETTKASMGLYTKCSAYGEKMEKLLSGYGLTVEIFGPDSAERLPLIHDCTAWIVDVSDETECPVLDKLIDHCSDVPALFFFEHEQTVASLDKLKGFIQQAGL